MLFTVKAELYSSYMMDFLKNNPKTVNYNLPYVYRFPGKNNKKRIISAWNELKQVHPVLDCIFSQTEGGWNLVYAPEKANPLIFESAEEGNIERVLQESVIPFDLDHGLVHLKLITTEFNQYFFLDFYHALTDGSGIQNLFQNLGAFWEKKSVSYDDYADLRRIRETWDTDSDRIYYEQRYGTVDWETLPRPDSGINGPRADMVVPIKKEIGFCNSIFVTAVLVAMAQDNGCRDVFAAWTFHSRFTEEEKKSAGLFIRDLPVGIHYTGQPLRNLYADVKEQIKSGIAHISYQYQMLEFCHQPVLYTIFQKNIYELPQLSEPNTTLRSVFQTNPGCALQPVIRTETENAEDPLMIEAIDIGKNRFLLLRYDSGLYTAEHMVKFGLAIKQNMESLGLEPDLN